MFLKTRFFCLLTVFALLTGAFCIPVRAAEIPKITWCTVLERDTHAVLQFETPDRYKTLIDGYELRTASMPWTVVADANGTQLTVPEGGYVYLRCFKDGQYSAEWSTYVQYGQAYMVSDAVTDVSAFYRESAAFPPNAYMTADRIIGGSVYESVQAAVQSSKYFELYDIRFLFEGATEFSVRDAAYLRFPLGDSFKRGHCKIYYNDTESKRMFQLGVTYDRTSAVCRSRGNGLYFIVDEWNGQSEIQTLAPATIGKTVNFYGFSLLIGDLNDDNAVDTSDARLALRAAVGLDDPDIFREECADIDRDGQTAPSDARSILRYSVGLQP